VILSIDTVREAIMPKSDQTTSKAKLERVRSIIARVAQNEDAICELMQTDPRFDALCHEYAIVGRELESLTRLKSSGLAVQATELQKRRLALEEELLTTMEGYRPV
jgi:uncharacterized protein YdcH (DUF465 family)